MGSKFKSSWLAFQFLKKGNNFWYIHIIEYYTQLEIMLTVYTIMKKTFSKTQARQKFGKIQLC